MILDSSNKLDILNQLHDLLVHNVIGDKQYNSRYNGFVGELDFHSWFTKNRKGCLIDGGMFIPTKKSDSPFESAIYLTSSSGSEGDYKSIYAKVSEITPKLVGMYFIKYELEHYEKWNRQILFNASSKGVLSEKSFSVPTFNVYKFDPNSQSFEICAMESISRHFKISRHSLREASVPNEMKNKFISKLSNFKFEDILKLYLERLFFDGYLNLTYTRGAPLDIDAFVYGKKGELCLLEIKEKDISKREPKGFGMDIRRIKSLNELTQIFNSRTCYVVRHINDQKERKFVDWRLIDFKDFNKHIENSPIITGGTGMRRTNSINPTQVCAFENFKKLD